MLLGILAGLFAFLVTFTLLFVFGTPTWFLIFPIAIGLIVGRLVANRPRAN